MQDAGIILAREQQEALAREGVILCYVFGSFAQGTARADSDLDIGVLYETTPQEIDAATARVLAALADLAPARELDVVILNEAGPLLRQQVASRGRVLFARSRADELAFQIRAMHDYESSRRIARIGRAAVSDKV